MDGHPGQTAETVDQRVCPHFKGPTMPRECATMPDSANRQFKANPRMLISAEDMRNTTARG